MTKHSSTLNTLSLISILMEHPLLISPTYPLMENYGFWEFPNNQEPLLLLTKPFLFIGTLQTKPTPLKSTEWINLQQS